MNNQYIGKGIRFYYKYDKEISMNITYMSYDYITDTMITIYIYNKTKNDN